MSDAVANIKVIAFDVFGTVVDLFPELPDLDGKVTGRTVVKIG